MKLFCSLPSPFARKVRALAAEKGIALALVVVDVLDPASPVAALNPLRKVPCLVTDDGEAWYDSPVICEWLDALPGPRLLPADFATRMAVKRVEALADGVMDAGVLARASAYGVILMVVILVPIYLAIRFLKLDLFSSR